MCGGNLDVNDNSTIAECEYCGSKQTVPTADNEKKINLFQRANRLRIACEFDKASSIYENIVAEFPQEPEAYWGLLLCKYGIEYVDDIASAKKVPTCHRSDFESVMNDVNLELALEYADMPSRKLYREEAKAIEELRKSIIEVSGKETPYDIFICYKETDENGERTIDSVLAQDVYDELVNKGYKVFFSRITLEDKLGQEYEPYIFAALNSAKIMLAFGTDYEYYNAVWVKNEWSRFLKLIAKGEKKTLIPCYKNIDAYDMPNEFSKFQAQDMGKVGAVQDLLRGIDKILKSEKIEAIPDTISFVGGPNAEALLKRGYMALEDNEWENAIGYFDQVLNMNAECGNAYLGMTMAFYHCGTKSEFADHHKKRGCENNKDFQKAVKYSVNDDYIQQLLKERQQYLEELEQSKLQAQQQASHYKNYNKECIERRQKEIDALKLELRELRGFFNGSRKKDIQSRIDRLEGEIAGLRKNSGKKQ